MTTYTPKPEGCDMCHWETTELEECDAYARTQGHGPFTPEDQKARGWLCNVCRSTYAGNAYQYPRLYENSAVLSTVAWGINYLASLIQKGSSS